MKRFWIVALVMFVCVAAIALNSQAENTNIKGDYVEVRTASVFAGACHYNGEVTTTGREALMAWKINSGSWDGTDLTGVRAVAVVTAEDNLSNNEATRSSELILDESATRAQQIAMLNALKTRYASELGKIVSVRSAAISFKHEDKSYQVTSTEAALNVEAMPDDLCCRMPNLIWYDPLVQLSQRKVGYTVMATYKGHQVGDPWQRAGENSAFYGSFSF
jgi:hypothetical protein